MTPSVAREPGQGRSSRRMSRSRRGTTKTMPMRLVTRPKPAHSQKPKGAPTMARAAKKLEMKPREPPALPMVATTTISEVLIFCRERKKKAKKKRAAMVGPSSMTPKLRVR
jgi:hypothetical protein